MGELSFGGLRSLGKYLPQKKYLYESITLDDGANWFLMVEVKRQKFKNMV